MRQLDVLIVGSGGREHALAWKLRQSPLLGTLYVAPGNPGTETLAENVPIAATDVDGLVRFVAERKIDLTVVGPEAPLVLDLAGRLRAGGHAVVGPDAAAARIEGSKAFAKAIMAAAGVPTAAWQAFDDYAAAQRYVAGGEGPLVVKADGLAAGKGVTVCADRTTAEQVIRELMLDGVYGGAGRTVVLEELLEGREVSLLALVDGRRAVGLPLAQDHKRLGEGDTGPNTGGMGALAPVPGISLDERDRLVSTIIQPVVDELAARGTPFRGVLFAGLMLTARGPRVLEFNCRLGDPETQAVLPLLAEDLLPWLLAVAGGELPDRPPAVHAGAAVGVVLAAPGYPEAPHTGAPIEGLNDVAEELLVFQAGTARKDGTLVTAGGRILTVVGRGEDVSAAAAAAHRAPVRFEGMQCRRDIGRSRRARIGVLASGDGSNLQALLDACAAGHLPATVGVVISHRAGARALDRATQAGVPAVVLPAGDARDPVARRCLEERLLQTLREHDVELAVLAGWMRILSETFLAEWCRPVINLHPALLPVPDDPLLDVNVPVLRGAHAVRDALALGLPFTGVSVHHVTPEVDAGPVIRRELVSIEPGDDEASLYQRIKAVEHRVLSTAVNDVLQSLAAGGVHA